MNDFLLCPASSGAGGETGTYGLAHKYLYGTYSLFYDGPEVKLYGETGVYVSGYIIPRSDEFSAYGSPDQCAMAASMYQKYGRSFTLHLKGYFAIIIFSRGQIEIYTDHLGLFRVFYHFREDQLYLASSVRLLRLTGLKPEFDAVSTGMQALFNRVPLHYTVFRDIYKNTWGDSFSICDGKATHNKYWEPDDLLAHKGDSPGPDIEEFAELFRININSFSRYLKPSDSLITLTGGKDSRTILAALLGAGQRPAGLTYGNERSRDAIYAGILARASGIRHMIIQAPDTRKWFETEASRIVARLNPEINIHRSHRNYAFAMAAESFGTDTAFYSGYLGGELLMGIYFDDLIFTDFLKNLWESGHVKGIREKLAERFMRSDNALTDQVSERISQMKSMGGGLSAGMKAFHGIFEIGIPHHSQDVYLSAGYWNYPCPVFLDAGFLELLFRSRYSFLHKNNESRNPLNRHSLYTLNMHLQHILYPGLDRVPFGKKGSYDTTEYLKGPMYWSAVKSYRYLTERRKYPPSFAYGETYRSFLTEALEQALSSRYSTNDFFDTEKALAELKGSAPLTSERHLHKYSNIVMFNLLEQELKK